MVGTVTYQCLSNDQPRVVAIERVKNTKTRIQDQQQFDNLIMIVVNRSMYIIRNSFLFHYTLARNNHSIILKSILFQ